jgi:hypothetical protein
MGIIDKIRYQYIFPLMDHMSDGLFGSDCLDWHRNMRLSLGMCLSEENIGYVLSYT